MALYKDHKDSWTVLIPVTNLFIEVIATRNSTLPGKIYPELPSNKKREKSPGVDKREKLKNLVQDTQTLEITATSEPQNSRCHVTEVPMIQFLTLKKQDVKIIFQWSGGNL